MASIQQDLELIRVRDGQFRIGDSSVNLLKMATVLTEEQWREYTAASRSIRAFRRAK